jgi:putative phosphoesterase
MRHGPPQTSAIARTTLQARPDGTLALAVVADTHGRPSRSALAHIAEMRPDAVLHAGDVGRSSVLDALREIAPVIAVRGNVDAADAGLPDTVILDIERGSGRLRILMTHIAVNGPRLRTDVARRAAAEEVSLVICGHSHVPFVGQDRGITVLNPGSIGPRRFTLPVVWGVIALDAAGVKLGHRDAETGLPWRPSGG